MCFLCYIQSVNRKGDFMKKIIMTVIIVLLSLLILSACSSDNTTGENGQNDIGSQAEIHNGDSQQSANDTSVLGAFTAKDLSGNDVTEAVFSENKLTMVNIWATFCGPCINEMPALGEIAKEYADKGFGIVGIPVDITDEQGYVNDKLYNEAIDIVSQTKAEYPHIVPTASMFRKKLASVFSVPETIFVDSAGNQVGESYLGARSKEQWIEIIDELLGEMQ